MKNILIVSNTKQYIETAVKLLTSTISKNILKSFNLILFNMINYNYGIFNPNQNIHNFIYGMEAIYDTNRIQYLFSINNSNILLYHLHKYHLILL